MSEEIKDNNLIVEETYSSFSVNETNIMDYVPDKNDSPNGSENVNYSNSTDRKNTIIVLLSVLIGVFSLAVILLALNLYRLSTISVYRTSSLQVANNNPSNSSQGSTTDITDDVGDDAGTNTDNSQPQGLDIDSNDLSDMLSGSNDVIDDRYYEFEDMLVSDCSYTVELKTYEMVSSDGYTSMFIEYPVVTGDGANIDKIAKAAAEEAQYWIDLAETQISQSDDTSANWFTLYMKAYVTYMDDEKLSIAYSEKLTDSISTSASVISVNIDVKSGFKLKNTSIIAPDYEFAEGFIEKCNKQNGPTYLDYADPADILNSLTNEKTLIIFYTPLGLEVGINTSNGWSTATYTDYEQYLTSS